VDNFDVLSAAEAGRTLAIANKKQNSRFTAAVCLNGSLETRFEIRGRKTRFAS
jgi:hypothetical protein